MSHMGDDEVRRALRAHRVPDRLIERHLEWRRGASAPTPLTDPLDLPAIVWPVRLLLPWSYLVSDNRKYGVIEGKLLATSDYRRAKGLVRDMARAKLGTVAPASIPLELTARVWVPDEMRAHDTANFAKCAHDALEGVVYTKDRWLWKTTWEHAGCDIDAPRCELVIRPLMDLPPASPPPQAA